MRTDAEKLKFFSFAASSKKREGGEHSKKTLTIYGSRQEKRDKCESTLRDAAELICDPLKTIFNESLKVGLFPDIWKIARVTLFFKSGRKSDLHNYRPISVLSAVSRIFEKEARDQLFEFLTANNMLSKNQFAYRKLHSTITSLLNVTELWYSNIDQKNVKISLFLI